MFKVDDDPGSKYFSMAEFVLGRHIQAQYYDQSLPQLVGNPLAEVIQTGRTLRELGDLLRRQTTVDPNVRNLPTSERWKRLNMDCRDIFAPRNVDLQLAERVELAMYESLHSRNPLGPSVAFRSPETCFSFLGPTGNGKSCSIQRVLFDLFPQRITHTSFKGQPFEFDQILWMHMEIPPLGTVKQLCDTFFRYISKILKKPYWTSYTNNGRASDDRLLANMGTVIVNHGIALLSLDEIGRFATKGAEVERQLNALFEILNRTGIAVCLTGTFEALPLLRAHARVLGRLSAYGDWIWDRPKDNSKGWTAILKAIEPVQYVRHPVALTGDIAHALYFETQGLVRVVKILFKLTQLAAMQNKTERITPDLIHHTAAHGLILLRPMLTALRLGDRKILADFPQVFPNLEDPYLREIASHGQIDGALKEIPELRETSSRAKKPAQETAAHSSAPATPQSKTKPPHTARRRKGKDYRSPLRIFQGTLPHIVEAGRQQRTRQTAVAAIKAAGLIRSALEFLPVETEVRAGGTGRSGVS